MKNKWAYILIGAVAAIALTFGAIAFAEQSSGGGTSQEVKGNLALYDSKQQELNITVDQNTESYPLAKSVWVYRDGHKATLDDLQPGDQLEIILNTKNQAAYIKAYSAAAAADKVPAEVAPKAESAPPQAPKPDAPPPQAAPLAQPAPLLDGPLKLQVKGEGFELEIEREDDDGGPKSKLKVKSKGYGNIHLEGEQAQAFIAELLRGIDLRSDTAEQDIAKRIGDVLQLKGSLRVDGPHDKQVNPMKRDDGQDHDEDADDDNDRGGHPGQNYVKSDDHAKGDRSNKGKDGEQRGKGKHDDRD